MQEKRKRERKRIVERKRERNERNVGKEKQQKGKKNVESVAGIPRANQKKGTAL